MPKLDGCCFLQCFQREEVITSLDFSNTTLAEFPQIWEHERTLEDLCLNSTRLSSLPPQLFYCQGLRILGVCNNNLENIPNAIGSLRQLQSLNVSRNFISSVPENLKNCRNLTHLDLSCNNLQRLPDAITCLVNLQELFLNETYLEFLPANFGRLINLRILELRLNSLITLPKSMGRLVNLQRIDIGGNEFTELPEVIGELSKLRELWVDFNQIRRISPNLGKLHALQHFEANGNLIESLPEELSTWHSIEVYSICTNKLKRLPQNFGQLNLLVTLKCEYCELVELPDSISSLAQLEEIVVSHNNLALLPASIGMLRKLRFLFADDNNLQTLPDELCSCAALTVLSISSNKLTDLPQNIGHLTKLKVLNLVDNYIATLPVSVLNMNNLSSLWLSDNQTQPLVPLQYADVNTKTRLTCFMLPQNRAQLEHGVKETLINTISTHASPTRRICFANETQSPAKDDCAVSTAYYPNSQASTVTDEQFEPRLMRSPTPYPKELRMMSKYMRTAQKLPQKTPEQANVKEARIIVNNLSYNCDPKMQLTHENVAENTDNTQQLSHTSNNVGNTYNEAEYFIYTPMQLYDVNNMQYVPQAQYEQLLLSNPNVYTNYNGTATNEAAAHTVLCDDQTVLRANPQQQQFMTPPPYHIARNYTKKTLEDLSNYDSMRNRQYLMQKESTAELRNDTFTDDVTNNFTAYDEQNNLLSNMEYKNEMELTERTAATKPLQNTSTEQLNFSQFSATENYNQTEPILQTTEFTPTSIAKKTTWLFGVHKNPTVKQITLRQENECPAFLVGTLTNEEGIYILSIVPNSNASRLLSVYDKLLEVNGHDFTDISLAEAKHILANAGSLINIMLSRK